MKYSVYLRAFKIEDAEIINQWRNNQDLYSLTCGRFRYVGFEMEKSWITNKILNNSKEEYFAICLNDGSNKLIGYQCLREIDNYNRSAHAAGIVISPDYQDGFYMVDASLLMMEYAFKHIGVNRLTGACLEQHLDSRTMMEMLGYKLEGIERQSLYKFHQYMNVCKYSILYGEYMDLQSRNGYSLKEISKRALKIRKQLLKK